MNSILKGFLRAVIVAIVSFVVIFFIFPDFSDKYFGISCRSNETSVRELKEEISDSTKEVRKSISEGKDEVRKAIKNI